jgi:transketolase
MKGKGVAAVENKDGWHGKPLADPEAAVAELGGRRDAVVRPQPPAANGQANRFATSKADPAAWEVGEKVATRRAYGDALVTAGAADGRVVALDGEVGNSTYSELFMKAHPDRYFEMYIAEQQLVAAAVGMQVRGWVPFASTFAAFLARAYDFTRMAAVSQANIRLSGSHAGVSIGEDGPSQMALEDLASFRAVHGSTVLYPSCANQTAKLVEAMVDRPGVVYLRTTRENTPVLYPADEPFPIGGSRVVRSSDSDDVTLIGAGITLHQSLAAAEALAGEGIAARVIDLYSVKPIDAATLVEAAEATGGFVVTEDHWPEGGIRDAVLEVLVGAGANVPVTSLAPSEMPTSGTPAQLLDQAGIDSAHIAAAARSLVGAKR